jgi:DNA adenine methylase
MRTPFPIFGGKGRVAEAIWQRFGDPMFYVEPFAGSLATLLARPWPGPFEYVGDINGMVSNFFRSVKWAPDQVAEWCDDPPMSLDKAARLKYLDQHYPLLVSRLAADPHYYDAKLAGWFAWCQSCAVMGDSGVSIRLGQPLGIHRERAHGNVYAYIRELSYRLNTVNIYHGHWDRLARAALRFADRGCAILLDPPYGGDSGRMERIYRHDSQTLARHVKRWAIGAAKLGVQVAMCGYSGEHDMPSNWEVVAWCGQLSKGQERIWFSPNCRRVT